MSTPHVGLGLKLQAQDQESHAFLAERARHLDYILFQLHILDPSAFLYAPTAWCSVITIHPFIHYPSLRSRYSGSFNSLPTKQVSNDYPCMYPKGHVDHCFGVHGKGKNCMA